MKCPQRGKKKNYSSDMSVRHTSNSMEHRGAKASGREIEHSNPQSRRNKIQASPCRYGTESNRTRERTAARATHRGSPRAKLGARIPPARRGNRPTGAGQRRRAREASFLPRDSKRPFLFFSWWRTRRRFCQHSEQGTGGISEERRWGRRGMERNRWRWGEREGKKRKG